MAPVVALAAGLLALAGTGPVLAATGASVSAAGPAPTVTDERITFTSGGVTVVGHHYSASTAPNRPILVMAPGFASVQSSALPAYAEAFAAAGYDALTFDYRSWGESAGTPRSVMDIPKQLADWRAAVAKARTLPGIDPDRVVLWGSSFAGGHVLKIAAEDHRVPAVIAQVPQVDGLAAANDPSKPLAVTAKLAALAAQDSAASAFGRAVYIPIVGHPGDVAALTAPGAYEGYLAAPPPGWDNRVAARIILQIPVYNPKNDASRITAPTFIGVALQDTLVSPSAALDVAKKIHAETHTYAGGHFDVYTPNPVFPKILADELVFLKAHVTPAPVA